LKCFDQDDVFAQNGSVHQRDMMCSRAMSFLKQKLLLMGCCSIHFDLRSVHDSLLLLMKGQALCLQVIE
jgi:hypothetical protein